MAASRSRTARPMWLRRPSMIRGLLLRSLRAGSSHGEDPGDRIERGQVLDQAVDPKVAREDLCDHLSPGRVDVDGQAERSDAEVAELHDRLGVRADGELAAGLQPVVEDQAALAKVQGDGLVDVPDL